MGERKKRIKFVPSTRKTNTSYSSLRPCVTPFSRIADTGAVQDKPYWYAVVDSPELASVSSDGSPFADYIAQGEGMVQRLLE